MPHNGLALRASPDCLLLNFLIATPLSMTNIGVTYSKSDIINPLIHYSSTRFLLWYSHTVTSIVRAGVRLARLIAAVGRPVPVPLCA